MLYLLNTTIMPNDGVYVNRKISVEQCALILDYNKRTTDTGNFQADDYEFTSAIGHQGSADALNALFLGLNCEVNRIPAVMQPGDEAIAIKVLGRLPEGQILTLEELGKIGFEFYYIKRLPLQMTDYIPEYTTYGLNSIAI